MSITALSAVGAALSPGAGAGVVWALAPESNANNPANAPIAIHNPIPRPIAFTLSGCPIAFAGFAGAIIANLQPPIQVPIGCDVQPAKCEAGYIWAEVSALFIGLAPGAFPVPRTGPMKTRRMAYWWFRFVISGRFLEKFLNVRRARQTQNPGQPS
ncbi:MAG TPA: hypothetical protein VN926_12810 [Bradyrhizobium sp.]|nr:hypothetical protein [Bradyrhizobium sp.]